MLIQLHEDSNRVMFIQFLKQVIVQTLHNCINGTQYGQVD